MGAFLYVRLTACRLPHVLVMGYPLVGRTRKLHFDGTNFKSHKLPEKAHYPGAVPGRCVGRLNEEVHVIFP